MRRVIPKCVAFQCIKKNNDEITEQLVLGTAHGKINVHLQTSM